MIFIWYNKNPFDRKYTLERGFNCKSLKSIRENIKKEECNSEINSENSNLLNLGKNIIFGYLAHGMIFFWNIYTNVEVLVI